MNKPLRAIVVALLMSLPLAACNSTEATLGSVESSTPNTTLPAPATAGEAAPPSTPDDATAALPANLGKIQFAPVVGATVDAATPLSQRLKETARARGLAIAGTDETPAYVLKGYFSAFSEGKATLVIFVWDVLDPSGNRLHRIQGQQKVDSTAANAWDAVTPEAMQAIADRTMNEFTGWLAARRG